MDNQYLKILLFLLLFIPCELFSDGYPSTNGSNKGLTANDVVGMIKKQVNNKFSRTTVCIIGDPSLKVKNVAYAAGAPGYMAHVILLEKESEWLSGFIKDTPVLFIPAGDSFSNY